VAPSDDNAFREWYDKNRDRWNEQRRDRYHTDSTYREQVLERNRVARAKRAETRTKRKKRDEPGFRFIKRDGVRLFSVKAMAMTVGKSVSTVRTMIAKGKLPPPTYVSSLGERYYSLGVLESMVGVFSRSAPRELHYRWAKYRVRWADGSEAEVALFSSKTVAIMINRESATVTHMELLGRFPKTPLLHPEFGGDVKLAPRLYTFEMVEAVRRAYERETQQTDPEGMAAWKTFTSDVSAAWEQLGVVGAKVLSKVPNSEDRADEEVKER